MMKPAIVLATAGWLCLSSANGAQCFYRADFEGPMNHVGQPPSTDFGNSNRPAALSGSPVIVSSFDQITNQALLLRGMGYEAMDFALARGASNYFADFDFESHNLGSSGMSLFVSFWRDSLVLQGTGELFDPNSGQRYSVGWKDNQVHHVHVEVSLDDLTWKFQLDEGSGVSGPIFPYGDDIMGFDVALSAGEWPADSSVQVAVDNLRIGTTDTLFPLTTLHWFSVEEGTQPRCKLACDQSGAFYGTAQICGPGYGTNGGNTLGSAFKVDATGELAWAYPFYGTNGSKPLAGLVRGRDGFLYGTTSEGGDFDQGTAFKISANGVMAWSVPFTGTNGAEPSRELVEADGVFYGTAAAGGAEDKGAVFSLTGDGRISVLYSFTGGADGGEPYCQLLPDRDGSLYGTTTSGGSAAGAGTVFKLRRNGKLTTLFSFEGANGFFPCAGLTDGENGFFYGTTAGGGEFGFGTVFRIRLNGEFKLLHSFSEPGRYPEAELVRAADGGFYGTTIIDKHGLLLTYGSLFKIAPDGTFTSLALFHGGDGSFPHSGLVRGPGSRLYGTTPGAAFSGGNLFSFPAGRPCIVITMPKAGARLGGRNTEVSGKTKGDPCIASVFCQINGGAWKAAETTNAWANWTVPAPFAQGLNTIRAYAVNVYGSVSRTNEVRCFSVRERF